MPLASKRRRITLWVVLLLAALSLWLQQKEHQPLEQLEEEGMAIMDYSLSDFEITAMDERGRPKHRLNGVSLKHYAETDYAELEQPHLEVYRDQGGAMLLDAEQALVYQGGESVLLKGDVKMLRHTTEAEQDMEVQTRDVWFYADREVAETSEQVTIRDGIGVTTAKGMRVDTKAGNLHLLASVRGEYVLE